MPTTTIGTAASVWGLVMALAPLLQIARMVRRRSSRDLSVGYFIVQVEVDGMQLNLDPPTEAQKPWPTHSAGLYAELLPVTTTVAALILILTLIPPPLPAACRAGGPSRPPTHGGYAMAQAGWRRPQWFSGSTSVQGSPVVTVGLAASSSH